MYALSIPLELGDKLADADDSEPVYMIEPVYCSKYNRHLLGNFISSWKSGMQFIDLMEEH